MIMKEMDPEVKLGRKNLYGEDVKMVCQRKLKLKLLTAEEKDEVVKMYHTGLNMTEIAKHYSCHHTTIGRILRKRNVCIR